MPTVNTVTGPVDTKDLGFTLMHEHIIVQSPGVKENFPVFDRAAGIKSAAQKLKDVQSRGVKTMVDLTVVTEKPVTKEAVNAAFKTAAEGAMKRVLKVSDEPLVSIDLTHDNASSIVDLGSTTVVGTNLLRVAAWYDNEWGFSCRMLDMVRVATK